MNMIQIWFLTEDQRANVVRYQNDRHLRDAVVCPKIDCKEEYRIPGMTSFFPFTRRTVLQLKENSLFCPNCKENKQDWVTGVMAGYDEAIQLEVRAALKLEREQQYQADLRQAERAANRQAKSVELA